MHDHIVAELSVELEQLIAEVQVPGRRTGCPLTAHRSHVDGSDVGVELERPLLDPSLELLLVPPAMSFHGLKLFLSRVNNASTVVVTFSTSSSSRRSANVTCLRSSRSSASLRCQFGNLANASATFLLAVSGF